MKCNSYATLGIYRNIMMPVNKSDFRRKKKVTEDFEEPVTSFDNLDSINVNGCSTEEINYCNKYNKPCVLNTNKEPICEIGATDKYQEILKGMKIRR